VSTELAINWHIDPHVNKVFNKLGMKSKSLVELSLPLSEVLKAATANKTAEQIITKRAELKEIDNISKPVSQLMV